MRNSRYQSCEFFQTKMQKFLKAIEPPELQKEKEHALKSRDGQASGAGVSVAV